MSLLLRACAVLVATAATITLAQAQPSASPRPIKRVLTIHAGAEAFPGSARFDETITKVLYAHPDFEIDYYVEFLENEEFGETADVALRDYIRTKFRGRPPDIVIANTVPALQFALRHRAELFPGVPVVFVAAAPPAALLRREIPGVTGMVRDPSQTETIELALRLHPATTRVHVVAYAPAVVGYQQRVQAQLKAISQRITVTFANEPTLEEALTVVKDLPADSLLLYARYSPVTKGRVIFPDEMLPQIAEASPVPIYSAIETNLDKGVVGGMMRSEIATAVRLGEITLRILEGEKPENIPIESIRMAPIFDWRQMQRWGIDPASLPPGADIRFREPSAWDRYGGYIIGAVALLTVQTSLIVGLLVHRARRRRAESELRASFARIRELGRRLLTAQETERTRIARELHDDISQQLAILKIDLRQLAGMAQGPAETVASEAMKSTEEIATNVRNLSHGLYPAKLRLLGLEAALKGLVGEFPHHSQSIVFTHGNVPTSLPPDLALCVFRIVQEALQNAVKHSQAKKISVRLTCEADHLKLTVTDDGVGFDVERVGLEGMGLISMGERVEAMGGQLNVSSSPHRGTRLNVSIPVPTTETSGTLAV